MPGQHREGYPYWRARSRAVRRLIDRHRPEYEQYLAEERAKESDGGLGRETSA